MESLARTRILYALDRLTKPLRSDVLADGRIAAQLGLPLRSPLSLGGKVVERDVLFSALSSLANGTESSPLMDEDGNSLNTRLSLDADDAAIVEIDGRRLRFPDAALLASDVTRRDAALERALARHTLSQPNADELRRLCTGSSPASREFGRVMGILALAPESFTSVFKEKLHRRGGELGEVDIVPRELRYWENLIPLPLTSTTLNAFLADELAEARTIVLGKDLVSGFGFLSLSFCAPALVPKDKLAECSDDALSAMIEQVISYDDPFALVGAFELCAAFCNRDSRYVKLGDRLLGRLIEDMEWLCRATGVWSMAFVFATAALARSDEIRGQPSYWRRLVAATHASLVVRACGVTDVDAEGLLGWAVRQRGAEYQLSVLRDMHDQPNWRAEWAEPRVLAADIFGRAYGAVSRLPEGHEVATWQALVAKARAWIEEHKLILHSMLPAVLEGARRAAPISFSTLEPNLLSIFQEFTDNPSSENLIAAGFAAQNWGAPSEIVPALLRAAVAIRDGGDSLDDLRVQSLLGLCAHLACLLQDAALADVVMQTCLTKARTISDPLSVYEALYRIVEASSAVADRTVGQALLVEGVEGLARILPPNEMLSELASLLETLIVVDPSLAPPLGRALSIARVATSRS